MTGTLWKVLPMNRLTVSFVSLVLIAGAYFGGAMISAAFNTNASNAAEPPCSLFCPGSGQGGNIGTAVTVRIPSGGVGGSVVAEQD